MFVVGDGQQKELFSLVFKAPPNTAIQPHSHPDERSCFVLSGLSYFAYGTVRDETKQKALPPGSNYTEPAGAAHFAGTREQEAIVECTAVGPTGMGPSLGRNGTKGMVQRQVLEHSCFVAMGDRLRV